MINHALVLIGLLALAGLRCSPDAAPEPAPHPDTSAGSPSAGEVRLAAASAELVGIKLAKAERHECPSVLKAMGRLRAPQPRTAIVSYAFSGRIAHIHVKQGDWVEKRQPLLILESADVGEAKSEFYKAIANRQLAAANLERERQLMEDGIGVKKNLLAAEAEYKVAEATAEAAEKRLHVLGFTEDEVQKIATTHEVSPAIDLDAPIAGKVVAINCVLGEMVDASTEIMRIVDPRLLWADAEIYEKDIAAVQLGQDVEIAVPAYPGKLFHGKVSYIEDVVDEQTRTITVRAEVNNEDGELKPGMFADVSILLAQTSQHLAVPANAVLDDGQEKIVFVAQGERFVRRRVETGHAHGGWIQILAGLKQGETLVVEGNHELKSKLQEQVLHAGHVH